MREPVLACSLHFSIIKFNWKKYNIIYAKLIAKKKNDWLIKRQWRYGFRLIRIAYCYHINIL